MKYICYVFLIFLACNVSFSQEKTEDSIGVNDTSKTSFNENNINKVSVFKFYPNPVVDELFILGTNKIKTIELIDVFGNSVAIYHPNKIVLKIDVTQFVNGTYLLQVTDENNK